MDISIAHKMNHARHTLGFTMIELIVVLALTSLIAVFGVAMSIGSVSRSSVLQERDLFVTLLLRGARSASLANVSNASHGVYIDNDCHRYILFTGSSYTPPSDCSSVPDSFSYTNDHIDITNDGGPTILFERLSGDVLQGAGTITLSNGNEEQDIIINEVGQIDW